MRHVLALGIALLCSLAVRANAQQANEDNKPNHTPGTESKMVGQAELIVHPIRNAQPSQVADALKRLFPNDPRVKSVELSCGGVLFVRVDSDARDEVLGFLEIFDRPPHVVDMQVLLLKASQNPEDLPSPTSLSGPIEKVMEAIKQSEADKRLTVVDRVETAALEHQKVIVLRVRRFRVIESEPVTSAARVFYMSKLQETGMEVSIATDIEEGNKILVELGFQALEFTGEESICVLRGSEFDRPLLPTTLALNDGEAGAVSVAFDNGSGKTRPAILVIAARIRAERG